MTNARPLGNSRARVDGLYTGPGINQPLAPICASGMMIA